MPDELYVLRSGEETDEWVRPQPIDDAVTAAVADATDLESDDLDDVEAYVDLEDVASVLEGDDEGSLTFAVEGHDVTIDGGGRVAVDANT